jgi:hypothetical protein
VSPPPLNHQPPVRPRPTDQPPPPRFFLPLTFTVWMCLLQHFVHAISDAVREEVSASGVRVTLLAPGTRRRFPGPPHEDCLPGLAPAPVLPFPTSTLSTASVLCALFMLCDLGTGVTETPLLSHGSNEGIKVRLFGHARARSHAHTHTPPSTTSLPHGCALQCPGWHLCAWGGGGSLAKEEAPVVATVCCSGGLPRLEGWRAEGRPLDARGRGAVSPIHLPGTAPRVHPGGAHGAHVPEVLGYGCTIASSRTRRSHFQRGRGGGGGRGGPMSSGWLHRKTRTCRGGGWGQGRHQQGHATRRQLQDKQRTHRTTRASTLSPPQAQAMLRQKIRLVFRVSD